MNEKRIKFLNNTLNNQIAERQQQQENAARIQEQVAQRKNTDKLSYKAGQVQENMSKMQQKSQERNISLEKENQRTALLRRMNEKRHAQLSFN